MQLFQNFSATKLALVMTHTKIALACKEKKTAKQRQTSKHAENIEGKTIQQAVAVSAVSTEGEGTVPLPLTTAYAPSFWFTQNKFLEYHVTTRQETIMEKGIITFKHNFRLTFFDSLQNCWQPTDVHKREAIIRLINTLLQMCRGRKM